MILLAMVVMSLALSLYEKSGTRQRSDMLPIIGQESCWFAFGTLMQEGTEVSPVTVAGRFLIYSKNGSIPNKAVNGMAYDRLFLKVHEQLLSLIG